VWFARLLCSGAPAESEASGTEGGVSSTEPRPIEPGPAFERCACGASSGPGSMWDTAAETGAGGPHWPDRYGGCSDKTREARAQTAKSSPEPLEPCACGGMLGTATAAEWDAWWSRTHLPARLGGCPGNRKAGPGPTHNEEAFHLERLLVGELDTAIDRLFVIRKRIAALCSGGEK
jgi:hypothetical protein